MNTSSLYGQVTAAPTAVIGEYCVLGYPKEARLCEAGIQQGRGEPVFIGERCRIFNHVVVYEGVRIAEDCVVEDRVRIGYGSSIGPRCRLAYGAYICDRVMIGCDVRVAGFVCDAASIGDRSSVMGELVHECTQPHRDWWEVDEEPPVIAEDTVIGYGACVVGPVRVGPRSYVASGAVITKDVPPEHIATGLNVHTPAEQWTGLRLRPLIEHWVQTPATISKHPTR